MKRLLPLLAALLIAIPAQATGTRTFNSSVRPTRLLTKQFATNTSSLSTADPTPSGTNLTLTSSTGRSKMDGSVTVCLTNGFTAPITITVYQWVTDSVTPANSHWSRLAPVASGGINNYTQSVDSNYTTLVFAVAENCPVYIQSSANVTGNVYTDMAIDPNNPNSPAGY